MFFAAALGAAIGWGLAGFCGAIGARRISVVAVVLGGQFLGLLVLCLGLAVLQPSPPGLDALAGAVCVGSINTVSLLLLYRAYSIAAISQVAPVLALAPIVPMLFGLLTGEPVGLLQLLGAGLAIAGTVKLSSMGGSGEGAGASKLRGVPLVLAVASSMLFGVVLLGMAKASRGDPVWALVGLRIGGVSAGALAAVISRRSLRVAWDRIGLGAIAAMSGFDLLSTALYGAAARSGLASLAAVLGSMFPVVTASLSVVVLGERFGRAELLAYAAAFSGAALIVAG